MSKARKQTAMKTAGVMQVITLSMPSLGHGVQPPSPPDFGSPRFSVDEQAANPDKAMTRVIKDVLRVGSWKVGLANDGSPVMESFDEAKLSQINRNAIALMSSGHAINLGKGHGDEDLLIAVDDLIAPADQIKLVNGWLWASFYVTPDQAKLLSNPAVKVSAGLVRDYVAGDGVTYPGLSMVHIAATDRPVVTGQGSFLALANSLTPKGSSMDFAALKEAINALLKALGVGNLPDSADETTLIPTLQGIAAVLGGGTESAAETASDSTDALSGATTDPAAMQNIQAAANTTAMANAIREQVESATKAVEKAFEFRIAALTNRIESLQSEGIGNAKAAFEAKLTELGNSGVPAVTLNNKRTLGAKYGWDIALLDGLQPTIKMTNAARSNATADPPKVPCGTSSATDDEVLARLKARGGFDPKFMPTVVG